MSRRLAAALAAIACTATLAGCGGGDGESERRGEPRIPRAVANELADRSEAVADKIDAGDVCGAAHDADALEDRVEALIAEGTIPARYREELRSEALWLRDHVNCPQPPPPPAQQDEEKDEKKEEDEKGEDDNKGKGNGEGNGDGEDSVTVTLETPTLEEGE
jgi:hypothetical protein